MELLAVRLARLIAYFPTEEVNPRGRIFIPDVTPALVERYGFQGYPQKLEDYDEEKGVTYTLGRWNGISIDKLAFFSNGIVVDTRSSTDDSEEILKDGLTWVADTFGLNYKPEMLNRRGYLSELVVRCETPLNALNPALQGLTERLAKTISGLAGQPLPHETMGITFGFDPFLTKSIIAHVRIERLAEVPFSENKYFTGAPLPTKKHIAFLEEFEAALKG